MGALDGILVVSLEQAVAAPFCTCRLADAGARFCTSTSAWAIIRDRSAASSGALKSRTSDCLPRLSQTK